MKIIKKLIYGFFIITIINALISIFIDALNIKFVLGFLDLSKYIEAVIFTIINLISAFTLHKISGLGVGT